MSETTTAPAAAPEELVRELEAVLARRIEVVENENQRLRRMNRVALGGAAAAVGLSAVLLLASGIGRSTVSASTVEAERFVLRTPAGETRGEWRMGEGGATELVIRDGDGRTRVRLGMLPDGSTGLSFADAGGNSRAALGLLADQTTSLVFADRGGRTRAVLGYSADDAVNLVFADRRGATRAGMGIDAAGRGSLTLADEAVSASPEPAVDEAAVAPEVAAEGGPPGAAAGSGSR
jgi:hypothetical protein